MQFLMNSVFKFSTSTFPRVKKSVEALRLDLDGSREFIWGGGVHIHTFRPLPKSSHQNVQCSEIEVVYVKFVMD